MIGGHHQIKGYPRETDIFVYTEVSGFDSKELLEKLTIIDAMDALTDPHRTYRSALSMKDVIEHLNVRFPEHEALLDLTYIELEKARRIIS